MTGDTVNSFLPCSNLHGSTKICQAAVRKFSHVDPIVRCKALENLLADSSSDLSVADMRGIIAINLPSSAVWVADFLATF